MESDGESVEPAFLPEASVNGPPMEERVIEMVPVADQDPAAGPS